MISKFEDNIDLLCDKIKVPNEYRELAIMIYQHMGNLLDYKVSNSDDYDNLLSLIKKLDIRKKERMNNFFKIAKVLAFNTSTNIDFFTSLISKIDKALKSIEEGEYGFCEETGDPIGLARLEARPTATLSVEAQERHERNEKIYRFK